MFLILKKPSRVIMSLNLYYQSPTQSKEKIQANNSHRLSDLNICTVPTSIQCSRIPNRVPHIKLELGKISGFPTSIFVQFQPQCNVPESQKASTYQIRYICTPPCSLGNIRGVLRLSFSFPPVGVLIIYHMFLPLIHKSNQQLLSWFSQFHSPPSAIISLSTWNELASPSI